MTTSAPDPQPSPVAISVRDVDPSRDAAACVAIYAPNVEGSFVSFEERAPREEEMAARIARLSVTHPWLVAERDGQVAGYAYAAPFQDRPAYRWSATVTVYVDSGHRGIGVGRILYTVLFDRLRAQGMRIACAAITLPNEPSVALHERLGFLPVGVHREIGWKDGAWRDVGLWQLELTAATDGPPPEPLAPG